MAESTQSTSVVSLNDVASLLSALTSGQLTSGLGIARPAQLADCDIRRGCNTRDCACHGNVSAASLVDQVSLPEFETMRSQRIDELKTQLSRLEKGE
jgi:hypothetical protein